MIKFRNPFQIKDYIGSKKSNNRKNKYLKQLQKLYGFREFAFREVDPEYLTGLYSSSTKGNPVIYKLINRRAELASEVFNYVKIRDINTLKDVKGHTAMKTIDNANYLENTRNLLIKRLSVEYDLYGESMMYKEERGVAPYKTYRLFPMFAEKTEVMLGGLTQPIVGFTLDYITADVIMPEEVMWLRNYNPDPDAGYRGLSPLVSASRLIQMLEQGDKRLLNLFGNGGVDYILTPKPNTGQFGATKDQIEDTEDEINDSDNAGKTMVVKIPLDKIDLGASPIDLNVLGTSTFAIKALCFIYSFPYSMYEDNAKYSNQKEAKKLLYTQIGIPQANMICQGLTNFLGLREEGKEFYIDIDQIEALREDVDVLLSAAEKARLSINERREIMGKVRFDNPIYDEPMLNMGDQLGYTEDDGLGLDDGGGK